jgi:hypothetical protein
MIIMDKFKKRLSKLSKHPQNAVVIGSAFGRLSEIIDVYETVFIFSNEPLTLKSKNLISKESISSILNAINVTAICIDLDYLDHMEKTLSLWHRWKPLILIEGGEPISRDKSQSLYKNNYRCVDLHGVYHVWKFQQ